MILNAVTAGLLALSGSPAVSVPGDPVTLVVGLRSGAVTTVDVPGNQVSRAMDRMRDDPTVAYVEPDHVARISAVPGQWGFTATGVDQAWGTTHGASTVVVAVVDTGVTAIPDLAGRLLPGRDVVNNDDDATDDQGHGTMTAGLIAAGGTNGVGIDGICWTCRILPVKVLDAKGGGSYTDIDRGIRWAADRGADIINLSLGGDSDSRLLRESVAYATARGALVIAAAGNEGSSAPHYPAAIPDVLAVGGSTPSDTRYPWSNYGGDWVDIAAPGCNLAQSMKQIVGQFCGTSSATPFVSGVAALLASTRPTSDAKAIRAALTSTADPIAGNWTGSGRVNAGRALAAFSPFRSPAAGAIVRGKVRITARATGVTKVELTVNGKVVATDRSSPYALTWDSRAIRGATVTLGLKTYDRGGNVANATRRVTVGNARPAASVTLGRRSVTVTASDRSGIRRLDLLVNGKVTRSYAGRSRRFPITATTTVSVRGRAYDRAGNVTYTAVRRWHP